MRLLYSKGFVCVWYLENFAVKIVLPVVRDGKSYVTLPHQKPPPDPASVPPTPPHPLASGSGAPVFVPPFLKRSRTDNPQTNPDPHGTTRTRTPAVFIPPFKKPLQPQPPTPLPPPPSSPTPAETSLYVRPATIATKSPAMVTETHGEGGGSGCYDDQATGVPGESAAMACDPATKNQGNLTPFSFKLPHSKIINVSISVALAHEPILRFQ